MTTTGTGTGPRGNTVDHEGTYTLTAGADDTSTTYAGTVSGSGQLIKAGNGTWTISAANTYTGGTNISAGTLKLGNVGALGTSAGAVGVTSGASLDLNGLAITNTNALTLNGVGTGSLGALLNTSATAASYAGAITLGSDSTVGGSGGGITLGNTISGNFGLNKVGSHTLTLSGANTYTGNTAINAGTLSIASDGNLGATSGGLVFGGEIGRAHV